MNGSTILFTLCLVFAIIVAPTAANEYTRLSEQNLTDAHDDLKSLDLLGALYHFLDAQHWSNIAIEEITITPTQSISLMEVTNISTETPTTTPSVEVTKEPTPVPTSTPTALPTESDESKNHKDVWVGQ
jgi:hypothetical protein